MRWFQSEAPKATREAGQRAEDRALAHLQRQGLRLVQRNFRTPGRGGGEIDLIMREPDGTLVFVEVRQRRSGAYGGAAASIGLAKRRRIVFAARHFLARQRSMPRMRFDAVLIDGDGGELQWLRAAFDAGDAFAF
ncbi:MAG: YraN family protein [Hydrogenophaga sp.]|uniref:YraN family protein n=1 Tax=Hydrogenophaga sp. TaxID=1904254 RepID=UPI00169654DD|nr:YraN family protein [Hydrogenophaga sp.]NIM43403.1 YraN family protein [Hydrogenophaga sp.]NIN28472.1 YraN family protein [Hydrogenophaga sp.]NIN32931.1 YraN family protein [Hydrogenophaga sp.]NIN57606.1 YraN family protein [Hydrogenophaga sp.]NIO53901.1 YraN family protein [Hydrogenophaga sp.]